MGAGRRHRDAVPCPPEEDEGLGRGCHEEKLRLVLGPQLHPHQGQSYRTSVLEEIFRVTEHNLHFTDGEMRLKGKQQA